VHDFANADTHQRPMGGDTAWNCEPEHDFDAPKLVDWSRLSDNNFGRLRDIEPRRGNWHNIFSCWNILDKCGVAIVERKLDLLKIYERNNSWKYVHRTPNFCSQQRNSCASSI